MAALANARHEAFAQALAKGATADEAYVTAGFKPNRGNAATLKAKQSISARVAELAEKGAERAEIDIARVLKELVRLGTSDIRGAFTEDGQLKRPQEWTDEFAAAVASIEVVTKPGADVDEDGNRQVEYVHKIKVWDKNSALEKIAKHLGMFIERHEHDVSDNMTDLLRELDGKTRGIPTGS